MAATRAAALVVGIVFGFTLCWSGMSNPEVIRSALLLEQSYLFLFFASAVLTAAVGQALLRRAHARAPLADDEQVVFSRQAPRRRHLVGGFVFGLGWGVANVCPGPIATQLGQGMPWALFTLAGVVVGILLFFRRGALETEPASDAPTAAAAARPQSLDRVLEEPSAAG
jgi:uncharacterized membrane protein YedE/YeeE